MADRPDFKLSADTSFLTQRLRRAVIGEVITYADLSKEIGKPVHGATPALHSARRILLRDEQMVFDPIRGHGLKRLSDHEIVNTGPRITRRLHRAANRGVRVMAAIQDFSALTREEQMRHTATLSVTGLIAEATREKNIQKIEKIAEGRQGTLPISQTVEAFRR